MPTADLLTRLAGHRIVGDLPTNEMDWLVSHGTLRRLEKGALISSPTLGPINEMYIVFSGRIAFYRERGGARRRVIEWEAGDITGFLPFSRMTIPPGEGCVEETADVLLVHRNEFPALVRECPALTAKLVWVMIDRARYFQKDDLQRERLVSLGKLAAGLAHELDNPTSAALRGSRLLDSLLEQSDEAARALGAIGLSADELAAIKALRGSCRTSLLQEIRSPLDQARHEEAISDWLDDRGIEGVSVEEMADSPISVEMLEELAAKLDPRALAPAVRWLSAGCALSSVAAEIQEASVRTSDLVRAVKGFSQVDRSQTPEAVDIHDGLMQTLTMLRAKARSRSVRVDLSVEPDLPRVQAVAGELNQVWHNLIDNALDAVGQGGSVTVSARPEGSSILVTVVDDGPGIPSEIKDRIFEPFFTTKPAGEGTGLGLDIVASLVDSQNGSIDVHSEPGRTEFSVRLPIASSEPERASR